MSSHSEMYWFSVGCVLVSAVYILCTFLYYAWRPKDMTGWGSKIFIWPIFFLALLALFLGIFVYLGIQGTEDHIRRTSGTATRSTTR